MSALRSASLVLLVLAGCSDVASHTIGIAGTLPTQQDLTAAELVDGWAVQFDRVVVVVHHPGLIEQINYEPAWVRRLGVTVWDLVDVPDADSTSYEVYSAGLRATTYDGFEFHLAPASASGYEAQKGNVDDDTLDAMVDADASIWVVGSATDGTDTITFDWTFSSDDYHRCVIDLPIPADGERESVIEIAAEMLLRDNLAGNPTLAFAPIAAADANGDGAVTLDELEAVTLASAGYDAAGADVANLGDWVSELSRRMATVVGASECELIEAPVEG